MEFREQMNIVVIGHVDHGKSTVIGRLLADTNSLPEGKLESVKEYCEKNSRPFEYAYLLDALKDEQSQGITIDSARCFFKTKKRDYIIIDAPGHIEFLKNMVTGASRAEAAVLVIDAKEGIQENTKRHGHLLSMLGIDQVVIVVNKMDLIDYDREKFNTIIEEFNFFLNKVNIKPIGFIPISGFFGDNIAELSDKTAWYEGHSVLKQLDLFNKKKSNVEQPFRMPVQDIYKFTENNDSRRIIAGTVTSGSICVGDEVVFLPSDKRSKIKSIEGFNIANKTKAYTDESIGLILDTQIYIKPGDIMSKKSEAEPYVSNLFRANIFWVGTAPLIQNKIFKLKIGATKIGVKLIKINNIIDAAELNISSKKDFIEKHDVAECVFETSKPIAFDIISKIENSGRFVIVDNYEISGGGIILESLSIDEVSLKEHIEKREKLWDKSSISNREREIYNKHKSKFVVITSGEENENIRKIGKKLEKKLFDLRYNVYYLGMSSIISGIIGNEGMDLGDRENQINKVGELARILTDSGQIFITSVPLLDDFEVDLLKLLNQPNEILIVNVGQQNFNKIKPHVNIDSKDIEESVKSIYKLLQKHDVVLEYYI